METGTEGGPGGGRRGTTLLSTKGGFILALVHSRRAEKKEGDPFKCGAAALIYWVKVGEKNEVAEVR